MGRNVVLAVHTLQAMALFWIATRAVFCCDADYYLQSGRMLLRDGLLWADPHAGYRFFFTPSVFGVLERILDQFFGGARTAALMPFALSTLFLASSTVASTIVFRREGLEQWARFAVPIFLNPLVISIVRYPLQESVVCIFAIPLLFLLLALNHRNFAAPCALGGLMVGFTFLSRSSLIWIAIPVIGLLVARARSERWPAIVAIRGGALAASIALLMYAPQAYINWNKFHTFAPIANSEVGVEQVAFGIDMLNYATVYDGATFSGLPAKSPYSTLPRSEKTLSFYVAHPEAGLVLVFAHAWSSLHFVSFAPYTPLAAVAIVTLPLLISATIVAYGMLALLYFLASGEDRARVCFLVLSVVMSCAYTALVATENRFGVFGFVALSVAAWQVSMRGDTRKLALRAAPLVMAYVGLCVMTNALLLYRTGALWPQPM